MPDSIEAVRLAPSQRGQATEVLIRAFVDDVSYRYVFPDEEERTRSLHRLWNALLTTTLRCGEGYTTRQVRGVACWLAIRTPALDLWQLLRTGFALPRAVMSFSREGRRRLGDALRYNDQVHAAVMREHHWYLGALAVDPPYQGQGIGGKLLQPVLARADAEGKPCYLETQTEDNVHFYQKHDFVVVHQGEVPGHGLRMWAMVRRPRP